MTPILHYCVLRYATGERVYAGSSESSAAVALVPGTVFGVGITSLEAHTHAMARAAAAKRWLESPQPKVKT